MTIQAEHFHRERVGGLGVTSRQVVERLYREIRSLRIYEGASEVQKVIIARNEYKHFGKNRVKHFGKA